MTISFATIVSRALELKYPIEAVLESVEPLVDEMVINVDSAQDDGTYESLKRRFREGGGRSYGGALAVVKSPWDWGNHDAGSELAVQSNLAVGACHCDWVLYLQADEILHEDDLEELRWLADNLSPEFAGVEFDRLYFWRDLKTLRKDWTVPMVRMFRRGRGVSTGDAMFCAVDGLIWPAMRDGAVPVPAIYHYTRIGSAEEIGARIGNLDTLFHPTEDVEAGAYDWKLRSYDSFARSTEGEKGDRPESVLVPFLGTHPAPALKWFGQ